MVWSNPNPNNLAPPVSDELRTITGRSGEIDCASWQSSKPTQNPNHQRRTQKGIIARRTSDGREEKEPPASPAARKEGFGVGGRTPAAVSLLLRLLLIYLALPFPFPSVEWDCGLDVFFWASFSYCSGWALFSYYLF
jgi:hypothetical protein